MAQKTTTVESALRLAKSHAANGNVAKARHFYLMILAKYPQNKNAKKGLKTLQDKAARETQPDLGRQEAELAKKEISDLIELYTDGKLDEALKAGKRLSQINPKMPLLHNTLGAIHTGLGQLDAAVENYERALKLKPDYAEAHNNLGNAFYDLNQLDAAVASYEEALKVQPGYVNAHFNLGSVLRELGQLDAAVTSCERALKLAKQGLKQLQDKAAEESPRDLGHQKTDLTQQEINNVITLYSTGKLDEALKEAKRLSHLDPKVPLLHNTLGAIHAALGKLDAAVESYEQALELKPDYAEVHNNLGAALRDLGQLDSAVTSCKQALALKPGYAEAYNNLGSTLTDLGQLDAAVANFERALKLQPDYAEAHYNLGNALRNLGQLDASVASFELALKLKPDLAEAHNNLGNTLGDLGQLNAAVASFERALKLQPTYAEAHNNLGNALRDLGQLDAAMRSCERALEFRPDYAEAHYNLGNALRDLGQLNSAVASFERALGLQPNYAEAYCNLGVALRDLGQLDTAVKNYERALQIKPDLAQARWNLSLAQLSAGNYRDGWENYELRWKTKDFESERHYPQPSWDGHPVDSKVILIYAEQGIGDEVMFSSCIPNLIDRHPKQIILECDHRLKPLFARSFPQVTIQTKRTKENHDCFKEDRKIDFQVAIGSLPRVLRPNLQSFSVTQPFLRPNSDLLDKWINRFAELGHGIKIGMSWRGGGKEDTKRSRSTKLHLWESISQAGAHFVNLQYGDCVEEIKQLKQSTGIHIHDWPDTNPLKDLDNFAAQIAALDLVISIDNSTVHFAGAMGTPVWILLPFSPDWRWLLGQNDSPWYPTARLFRQKTINDWEAVFNEVKQALKAFPMVKKKDSNLPSA